MTFFGPLKVTFPLLMIAAALSLGLSCTKQQEAQAQSVAQTGQLAQPAVELEPAMSHGQLKFLENCSACHTGRKELGPPLVSDCAYFVKAGVSQDELGGLLMQPVRVKREGSIMPAFTPDELSDGDLMEIGRWLASTCEPPAETPQLGDAAHGAELYAANCALCHGANGEGNGVTIPLAAIVGELRAHEMSTATILGFTTLATRSGSMKEMPVYDTDALSDSDLADIAAHLWELPPLGPPPGGEGETPAGDAASS